jgi:hypothetical protein
MLIRQHLTHGPYRDPHDARRLRYSQLTAESEALVPAAESAERLLTRYEAIEQELGLLDRELEVLEGRRSIRGMLRAHGRLFGLVMLCLASFLAYGFLTYSIEVKPPAHSHALVKGL